MASGSGRARSARASRAAARLLLLCAVLAGLFLMHGAPGSAHGCHGAVRTDAVLMDAVRTDAAQAMPPQAHAHAAVHPALPAAPAVPATGTLRAHGDRTLCVATKTRDGVPLPAPGPAVAGALLALPAAVSRLFGRRADSPRGPPCAGRRLLLQVCVART